MTDITDPAHPVTSPQPIDLFRNDGVTAYSHDVQVDGEGIAWVSGSGGVRGYWTEGTHHDPLKGVTRAATAIDPIPFAGGEFDHKAARRSSCTTRSGPPATRPATARGRATAMTRPS